TVNVPLMQQSERLGYAEGPGYVAVELPYLGGELSMVILLPAQGQFEAFAQGLDARELADILRRVEYTQVNLALPRFKFESEFPLKEALQRLGMLETFEATADFSGMVGRKELFIDDVYHKAFVAVDERGTEAAAATAVVIAVTSMPTEPKEVRVDRPFVFLIRDVETDAVLFLGHVVNPAQ
ncbi:MAG: serpin family protein, partial [Chloroflexi bacterium]|nr:serpin family protein [Chloroflexota bacterium]